MTVFYWGKALVFEVEYLPCKKIHIIYGVVFQNQAMYVPTLCRGAKAFCQMEKKCVFGCVDKFGKDMRD